jgi:crotonobetainyl-CoA:carnitine CoA-transferase CaiB-like acyl-CoA transferase
LAVTSDAQWQALVKLANGQTWVNDDRFASLAGRLRHVADLDAAMSSWTASQPRDALVGLLRTAGIASSPVLSVQEQWRDANFEARKIKQAVDIPVYGPEEVFRAPWRFSDFSPHISSPGPLTGQHNDFVFGELLGLPADEIAALKAGGVIA